MGMGATALCILPYSVCNGGGHVSKLGPWGVSCVFLLHDHARRLRLKMFCSDVLSLDLLRSFNGHFKPLVYPGGGFASKIAALRFENPNGHHTTALASEVKRLPNL
jgi:hypothetical protein